MEKQQTTEKWEKEFDKKFGDLYEPNHDYRGANRTKALKSFIKTLISDTAKNTREELKAVIGNLIAEEMLICNTEHQPTSRLTSLVVRIKNLK